MHVPLGDQVACVERELRLREKHYPRWVRSQKLTQPAADIELVRLRAVLATLKALAGSGVAVISAEPLADASAIAMAERAHVLSVASRCLHSSSYVRLEAALKRAAP